MDELDNLLRETFHAREEDAPADTLGLATAARAGSERRTKARRQLVAVGTVGALATGGASALALTQHGRTTPNAAPATTNAFSQSLATNPANANATPSKPHLAGTRPWSSHGIQVWAPEAWQANTLRCGTPIAPTVVIDLGAVEACALGNAPAVDVVEFGTPAQLGSDTPPQLYPKTLDGHSAALGSKELADGRTFTLLVVPDLKVSVSVKSKDPKLVEGIIASAQIVDQDAYGCASSVDVVEPGKPTRDGATSKMVPGSPVKAVVCHYPAYYVQGRPTLTPPTFLGRGTEVPTDQLSNLVDTLDSLKPGLAPWTGLAGSCPSADRDGNLIRFFYSSGPSLDVYLHTGTCDREGFDNGAVTGYVSKHFIDNAAKFNIDFGSISMDAIR